MRQSTEAKRCSIIDKFTLEQGQEFKTGWFVGGAYAKDRGVA